MSRLYHLTNFAPREPARTLAMSVHIYLRWPASVLVLATGVTLSGCGHLQKVRSYYRSPASPPTLGYIVDDINKKQEGNAEQSDFVIYQHEFTIDTDRLNVGGMDHVKQIAARLPAHPEFIVMIERSLTSVDDSSEYKYPVNRNSELDLKRREVVVRALAAMNVPDADQRVVISYALTPGQKATEAQRDYQQALGGGYGGFGGGFGGFGGFGGGFGGFGGGFGGGGFF